MGRTEWIADAWFVEVYGRVVATFRTKAEAQRAIADGLYYWAHPYLTHGPCRTDQIKDQD